MSRTDGILKKEQTIRENLTKENRRDLYATYLPKDTRERVGLTVQCLANPQDPAVTKRIPELKIESVDVPWEPGLSDGPTNSRLAVVDYNGDTDSLAAPARWSSSENSFLNHLGRPLTRRNAPTREFRQVSTWATVQCVLDMYEHGWALGRPVPWGFEGNRLIIVPHAGYGENAFYDRTSKSLQFYYFGDPDEPSYTCLSHDIVAHEAGHAVLDGIRPLYFERSSSQTAAFHEFIGDLTAILSAFANEQVRHHVAITLDGNLDNDQIIAHLAEEFGAHLYGERERPFLRSAHNDLTMEDVDDEVSPHFCSQVLTGAMFDFLKALAEGYKSRRDGVTNKQAFGWAYQRFDRMALQPLDLCPPVDIQFVDYARAVVRSYQLQQPDDPQGYLPIMHRIFNRRGLCDCRDPDRPDDTCALFSGDPPRLSIRRSASRVGSSRTAAYHFLDDNRRSFRIPHRQDFVVTDVYENSKLGRAGVRLPRQTIVEYVWREPVLLDEPRFGQLRGESIDLLCGGTVVLDERGNMLSWFHKPGTQHGDDREEGLDRVRALRDFVAAQVRSRRVRFADEEALGFPDPPIVARRRQGGMVLETTPALRNTEDDEPGVEEWLTNL